MIHKTIVLIILNEMNFFNELFSETNDFLIKLLNLFYNLMKEIFVYLMKKLKKPNLKTHLKIYLL